MTDKNKKTLEIEIFGSEILRTPSMVVKKFDKKLSEGDTVRLFSAEQIRHLDNENGLLHKVSTKNADIIDDPVLISFLKERSVFVRGAVRQSGAYPVTEGTSLKNILSVAGGIALEGNKESISGFISPDELDSLS